MKLSLSWIFDHINGSWRDYDMNQFIKQLNVTIAEIDSFEKVMFDVDQFTLAQVTALKNDIVELLSPELNKTLTLPFRSGCSVNSWYLIKKNKKGYDWATLRDFNAEKDGLLPSLMVDPVLQAGGWKNFVEKEDYRLLLDNKSITHRPDLWGHRGFAREIAALLGLSLKPEDHFMAAKPIKHYDKQSPRLPLQQITLEINTPVCKRLAGIYIDGITPSSTPLWMALRLCRIDARPLNAIIDTTNYVMYDLGQPMHAFDTSAITHNNIIATMATDGQTLKLLDDTTITLTNKDCIISDGETPLALAGIMGGADSAISEKTKSIFVEAANFDATTIRLTSTHLKKRTESSTRFEKQLDPHQNTQAILRFLKLIHDMGLSYSAADAVISLGALTPEHTIKVSHDFIIKKLGLGIVPEVIIKYLTKLGFGVNLANSMDYTITIPTFRGTKDITTKEDIIEEIGRFVGYTQIPHQAPMRPMVPFSLNTITKIKLIKEHCAYALAMHEVYNYAIYDEEVLNDLGILVESGVTFKNPLSERWKRLATSLIPHLLKNVQQNYVANDTLRFFELARNWEEEADKIKENKVLSGIFFDKKSYDFYAGKAALQSLFHALHLMITWQKPTQKLESWWSSHQTAELRNEHNKIIGYAGMLSAECAEKIGIGQGFIFELFVPDLLNGSALQKSFEGLPKYQSVKLDISMFVPFSITVADLEEAIITSDARIKDISLIDFFEKEEWGNQRSVTLRILLHDDEKTMTKEEIDDVWQSTVTAVKTKGVTVR